MEKEKHRIALKKSRIYIQNSLPKTKPSQSKPRQTKPKQNFAKLAPSRFSVNYLNQR
jgi:hypothetical protein